MCMRKLDRVGQLIQDPSQCNSTNGQNPHIFQYCYDFLTNEKFYNTEGFRMSKTCATYSVLCRDSLFLGVLAWQRC